MTGNINGERCWEIDLLVVYMAYVMLSNTFIHKRQIIWSCKTVKWIQVMQMLSESQQLHILWGSV